MEKFQEILFKYKTILSALITLLMSIAGISDSFISVVTSGADTSIVAAAGVTALFALVREILKFLGKEGKI
jgi:hypothetical protein